MDRRLVLFLVLALMILLVNGLVVSWMSHPAAPVPKKAPLPHVAQQQPQPPVEKASPPPAKRETHPAAEKESKHEQWVALGSLDPAGPYRMLVTLTNRGAAVERVELSDPRYRDLVNRSGYLGHLTIEGGQPDKGCPVDIVGPGTPAAMAGLQVGDVITKINDTPVHRPRDLDAYLAKTHPGQVVTLTILRDGAQRVLPPVRLRRQPLDVVGPEANDPLSLLVTLYQIDDEKLPGYEKFVGERAQKAAQRQSGYENVDEHGELDGLDLRTGLWELADAGPHHVTFRRQLPRWKLEITKTYRLEPLPEPHRGDSDAIAYRLIFDVGIRNLGQEMHQVAYQLDGPTGLPVEGYWYAYKVWRTWGTVGLRDVVASFHQETPELVSCPVIGHDQTPPPWGPRPLTFIGVDAQYFSAVMIPQMKSPDDVWFAQSQAIRVGPTPPVWLNTTDTSCRVVSQTHSLNAGQGFSERFFVFVGPKRPTLLATFGLGDLVYYGWFSWIARPLVQVLHLLDAVVRNYGVAIILLTVLVRLVLFPLSRKQTLGMVKMQQLQPEIKRIQERHKNDPVARNRALQELFRKHNYNPAGGCLVLFIQTPILLALYRALSVDVALRGAPLISTAVHWCSNLAAPDMLFNWTSFMPGFITNRPGMFGLGPYFNLLPILAVLIILWQQRMMMPPAADEAAALQQKISQGMMIFLGILFFKVASGLCLYFIVTSLWGIGERMFLPRVVPSDGNRTTRR